MEIEYKGGNCVVLTSKKTTVVVDPKLSSLGLKDITPKEAVVIATQHEFATPSDSVVLDGPGEYEVRNVSVTGVPAKRHIDYDDSTQSTMYRITMGDVTVAVIGHVQSPLTEQQLEALGVVDVAVVPVGGSGYTLDAHQAVEVVRQLDPKIVIPTHYADPAVKYEVPQMELEPFLKELGGQHDTVTSLKLKNGLPETLTVVEVTRTA